MAKLFDVYIGEGSDDSSPVRDSIVAGWRLICRAPILVVWRIVGDAAVVALRGAALLWSFGVVAAGIGIGVRGSGDIGRTLQQVDSVHLVGGLAGLVFTFWLVRIVLDSIVEGGARETLARALDTDDLHGTIGFFARTGTGFVRNVRLRLLEVVARTALGVTGATALGAVLYAFSVSAGLESTSVLSRGFFVAVPLFFYLVLALLLRATLRVAAAPLFVERRPVGESVFEASIFVLRQFEVLYRIFVRVAGFLLVPLLLYFGFIVSAQVWGLHGPFAPLLESLRVVGQVVLFASFSFASLLFDGAVFAHYHRTTVSDDVRESESSRSELR